MPTPNLESGERAASGSTGPREPVDEIYISDSDDSVEEIPCDNTPKPTSGGEVRSGNSGKPKRRPTRNFAPWEERLMVRYLIENRVISAARGNTVWRSMIRDQKLQHRTFHSLNNHFRKFILPKITEFEMDSESMAEFQGLIQ